MKSKARITVYEHDRLTTDQASFKTRHLNALLKLNEYHNFDYFDSRIYAVKEYAPGGKMTFLNIYAPQIKYSFEQRSCLD